MTHGNRQKSLTAVSVKRAKPKDKPYKLSDRDGLYLYVKPNGSRLWRMNYRFHGAQKTISFGRWPEVTLADAREKTLQARRRLADGIDPCEQKKLDRIAASIAQANKCCLQVGHAWNQRAFEELSPGGRKGAIVVIGHNGKLSVSPPSLQSRKQAES